MKEEIVTRKVQVEQLKINTAMIESEVADQQE
jgi:hypothetical protein